MFNIIVISPCRKSGASSPSTLIKALFGKTQTDSNIIFRTSNGLEQSRQKSHGMSSSVKLHFYFLGKDRNSHGFGFSYIIYEFSLNLIQLLESNVVGVLSKALTAEVQTIFADHTMSVGACTAVK